MKKKYLFILTFAVFAILMLLSTGEVKATTTSENTTLYVRTKIERWNDAHKDLKFIKNDNWGGSGTNDWYTKTVWLTDSATGDPNDSNYKVQITESMLNNNEISLGNSAFNLFNNPQSLEDVYLVEKYVINTASSNLIYTIGGWNTDNSLPCADRLDFSFNYSSGIAQTIKETSMNDYEPASNYTLYTKALYDDDVVTINRNLVLYFSFEESATKITEKSQGTITLPLYALKIDLTASGNAVEPGWFAEGMYTNNYLGEYPESSVGRASGYLYDGTDDGHSGTSFGAENSCGWDYNGINTVSASDFNVAYCWGVDPSVELLSSGHCESIEGTLSVLSVDDNYTNTYVRTFTGTYENNQTAPNGIFYNILPFVIAGIVAITGIVLLKKNSIKE